jgi:hypothetical protein
VIGVLSATGPPLLLTDESTNPPMHVYLHTYPVNQNKYIRFYNISDLLCISVSVCVLNTSLCWHLQIRMHRRIDTFIFVSIPVRVLKQQLKPTSSNPVPVPIVASPPFPLVA